MFVKFDYFRPSSIPLKKLEASFLMYMYIQHEDGGMFKSQGPVACVSVNEYINDVWAIHTIN